MKTIKKISTNLTYMAGYSLILAIFLIPAAGYSQNNKADFEDYDKNRDGQIEKKEFREEFSSNFNGDWDKNNNDRLDEDEFYSYNYQMVDNDNDNMINENEWEKGQKRFYGDYMENQSFDDLDRDNDNQLTYSEYKEAVRNTNFFNDWDTNRDNSLDNNELADGIYRSWEADNDGVLNEEEFNDYHNSYANW